MSGRPICLATPSATFSPGSAGGLTLCGKPVGPTATPSGPDPARANLSARQAEAQGLLTSGTFGPRSTISYESAVLLWYLANRYQAQTDLLGSTLYNLIWKTRDTPQQRLIPARRASVRRTSGSVSTGWPTPQACDQRGSPGVKAHSEMTAVAPLAGWASPQSRDHKGSRTGEAMYSDRAGRPLNEQAANLLDGWAVADGPARRTVSGEILTGSSAGMESGGQLSPEHSCWLQGFPTEWVSCGVSVMRSSLRKQSRS